MNDSCTFFFPESFLTSTAVGLLMLVDRLSGIVVSTARTSCGLVVCSDGRNICVNSQKNLKRNERNLLSNGTGLGCTAIGIETVAASFGREATASAFFHLESTRGLTSLYTAVIRGCLSFPSCVGFAVLGRFSIELN